MYFGLDDYIFEKNGGFKAVNESKIKMGGLRIAK